MTIRNRTTTVIPTLMDKELINCGHIKIISKTKMKNYSKKSNRSAVYDDAFIFYCSYFTVEEVSILKDFEEWRKNQKFEKGLESL